MRKLHMRSILSEVKNKSIIEQLENERKLSLFGLGGLGGWNGGGGRGIGGYLVVPGAGKGRNVEGASCEANISNTAVHANIKISTSTDQQPIQQPNPTTATLIKTPTRVQSQTQKSKFAIKPKLKDKKPHMKSCYDWSLQKRSKNVKNRQKQMLNGSADEVTGGSGGSGVVSIMTMSRNNSNEGNSDGRICVGQGCDNGDDKFQVFNIYDDVICNNFKNERNKDESHIGYRVNVKNSKFLTKRNQNKAQTQQNQGISNNSSMNMAANTLQSQPTQQPSLTKQPPNPQNQQQQLQQSSFFLNHKTITPSKANKQRLTRRSSKLQLQLDQIVKYSQMYPSRKNSNSNKIIPMIGSGAEGDGIFSSFWKINKEQCKVNGCEREDIGVGGLKQANQYDKCNYIQVQQEQKQNSVDYIKSQLIKFDSFNMQRNKKIMHSKSRFSENKSEDLQKQVEKDNKYSNKQENQAIQTKKVQNQQSSNQHHPQKPPKQKKTRPNPPTDPSLTLTMLDPESKTLLNEYASQQEYTRHTHTKKLLQKSRKMLLEANCQHFSHDYSFTRFIQSQLGELWRRGGRKTDCGVGRGVGLGRNGGGVKKEGDGGNDRDTSIRSHQQTKSSYITDIRQQPITDLHKFFRGQHTQTNQFSSYITTKQMKKFRQKYDLYNLIYKKTKDSLNIVSPNVNNMGMSGGMGTSTSNTKEKIDLNSITELNLKNAVFLNQLLGQCNTREKRREVEQIMSKFKFYN